MCDIVSLRRYALKISPQFGEDAMQDALLDLGIQADTALLAHATRWKVLRMIESDRCRRRRERVVGQRRGTVTYDADPDPMTIDELLSPLDRRTRSIVKRIALGETQSAVAKRLGVSDGTVGQAYRRALRIIHAWLESR